MMFRGMIFIFAVLFTVPFARAQTDVLTVKS